MSRRRFRASGLPHRPGPAIRGALVATSRIGHPLRVYAALATVAPLLTPCAEPAGLALSSVSHEEALHGSNSATLRPFAPSRGVWSRTRAVSTAQVGFFRRPRGCRNRGSGTGISKNGVRHAWRSSPDGRSSGSWATGRTPSNRPATSSPFAGAFSVLSRDERAIPTSLVDDARPYADPQGFATGHALALSTNSRPTGHAARRRCDAGAGYAAWVVRPPGNGASHSTQRSLSTGSPAGAVAGQ
jgi:hypothetical protein